jgi:hypothetical protein
LRQPASSRYEGAPNTTEGKRTVTYRRSKCAGLSGVAGLGLFLAGCAQTPLGPTVQVMPGPGKSFETFTYEQAGCKQFAESAVAGQAQNANNRAIGAAALTTALGAGLGAAVGGGYGAGIGAASGAAGGAGIGAGMSSGEQYGIQQQYDNAFAQCMYAKGNMVPGYGPMMVNAPPPPDYGYGSPQANMIYAIQTNLIRLGYLRTAPDGIAGASTSTAIARFERATGMPVTGVPSPQVLAQLQAIP